MARAGLGQNWQCLFANDFDEKKCQSYRDNWGSGHLWEGDVGAVSVQDLPSSADLAWASFPCQDLSLAGTGSGLTGKRSGSFWPFWRLMTELANENRRPKMIVLENVCGLLTSNGGQDFETIIRAMSVERFQVGAVVVNANHFLPQSRPRLFIIGLAKELKVNQSNGPNQLWHPLRMRQAVNAMPDFLKKQWVWLDMPTPTKRNISLDSILCPDDSVTWDSAEKTSKFIGMMSAANRKKLDNALSNGVRKIGTIYKRTRVESGTRLQRAEVRFDGIAGCLRTPGGGSSKQTVIVVDDGKIKTRIFTARETARLMGLSEEYILPENNNDAYFLTGDGVAVPVVKYIQENLLLPALKRDRAEYA